MQARCVDYAAPTWAPLRWLTTIGADVPVEVGSVLIGELLSSYAAVLMATLTGLALNISAFWLTSNRLFLVLTTLDVMCVMGRLFVLWQVSRARTRGEPIQMGLPLCLTVSWCAIQGTGALAAMSSNNATLQTLDAAMIMSIIGPICARNYVAPRLAFLLVCLCDLPFVLGCILSWKPWLWMIAVANPTFLYGLMQIVKNFQKLAVTALTAKLISETQARRDPLTGLANRLGFDDALSCARASACHVLICLDLDGFKDVNDTFGHHAGDIVLASVARQLESCVRPGDMVFRLGGDEFAIVATDMPAKAAGNLADRIIDAVSSKFYQFEDKATIRIGVSVGYACAPDDASDPADLYRKADAALYSSKAAGKGPRRSSDLRPMRA